MSSDQCHTAFKPKQALPCVWALHVGEEGPKPCKVDRGSEQQQQHTSLEQYSKFGLVVLYQVLLSAIVNIPHSNRLKPGLE